ncbi:MAG TPA: MarR family winged helix-turn-helix transcriptional regulator [Archangium sp.]
MKDETPEGADLPLEPALDFMQHLWALNHALERMSMQMERQLGVTAQQRLFIRCIGKYPGMTATQLAGVMHLDRGTVSVSLRRLSTKGLVQGKRDKEDNRRVALSLTPKGRALDKPDPRTIEAAVKKLLASVGGQRVANAKDVLARLAEELLSKLESE